MSDDKVVYVDFKEERRKKEIMGIVTMVENYTLDLTESQNIADIAADELVEELLFGLSELGYDLRSNPMAIKDIVMIYETIKSLVHRVSGQAYFMQENIDQIVRLEDAERLLNDILEHYEID